MKSRRRRDFLASILSFLPLEGGGPEVGVKRQPPGYSHGLARKMRRAMTDAERRVWARLRSKQLRGAKFRRQHPIGKYIVDFVCLEKKVIVELDGGQHCESTEDRIRDAWLTREGFMILRYWNIQALRETENVIGDILRHLERSPSPQSPPLEGGEE